MTPRLRGTNLLTDIEAGELAELAHWFQTELTARKAAIHAKGFDWYPFDSFGMISILDRVLTGPNRWLRHLIGGEPVLDVGCGDGSVSFFLESLGAKVHAIDHAPANYNRMAGVKTLKAALGSAAQIASVDLDSRDRLPVSSCGLAVFLGVLYHLKNPLGVLEGLACKAHYCLLTTAVTRYAPGGSIAMDNLPVAFLAGPNGLRGDETNYWIFTERGLQTLVDRAGWDIADFDVVDDPESTLWDEQRDQRAVCLLRSRVRPPVERAQLLAGWHKLENCTWRWTERRFSIALAAPAEVKLRCTAPPVLSTPLVLRCGAASKTFQGPGDYEFEVPAGPGVLEFELDRALAPDDRDGRERGIVVRAIEI